MFMKKRVIVGSIPFVHPGVFYVLSKQKLILSTHLPTEISFVPILHPIEIISIYFPIKIFREVN